MTEGDLAVYRTKTFSRWIRGSGLTDQALAQTVDEMVAGLIDADLGGHVVKKRVALPGHGKRSGARTIVATNFESCWFFLFGFEKNERSNIDRNELTALQEIATKFLSMSSVELEKLILVGELTRINHNDTAKKQNSSGNARDGSRVA